MKDVIKGLARRAGLVVASSGHIGARYLERPPAGPFDEILLRCFPSLQRLNFIQIGANDGIRADPIHRYVIDCKWRGVLVEPLPYFYAALRQTYAASPDLILINAAVDRQAGERIIYQLRPDQPGLPDWSQGLASFSVDRLRQAARSFGLPTEAVVSETIRTITWDEVVREFGPRACDVLVVDVEGYDVEILRMANLAVFRPRVIHFEHVCVAREGRLACYGELLDLGYEIATAEGDTIAYLPKSPATPAL
jgi:FkbM family methyltransferase